MWRKLVLSSSIAQIEQGLNMVVQPSCHMVQVHVGFEEQRYPPEIVIVIDPVRIIIQVIETKYDILIGKRRVWRQADQPSSDILAKM
jgi:hypothetical protein